MKPKNSVPSPARPSAAEKLKRSFFITLASIGLAFGLFAPLFASAGFFSVPEPLSSFARETSAAGSKQNSQTVAVLSPAINIDPQPSVGGGDIALVGGVALLSEDGPSGTTADVENAPPESTAISVYTVHKGDSLAGIAKMFGVTPNTIVWANDLKGGVIHEGDQLIILPISGVRYTVQKGDTLASVAKKYKGDANEIAQYNNIADNAPLVAGDVLVIPSGEVPPTAAQVAQTTRSKAIKSIAKGSRGEPYLGGSGPDLGDYFSWPISGSWPITQGLHGWNAVDIGAPSGTPILAAAGGTVIIARSGGWNGGYGSYVVVSHPNGTQTLYGHMSRVLVSAGQPVAQGTTLGRVGTTGLSTGSHLHFEVRGAVNPFAR